MIHQLPPIIKVTNRIYMMKLILFTSSYRMGIEYISTCIEFVMLLLINLTREWENWKQDTCTHARNECVIVNILIDGAIKIFMTCMWSEFNVENILIQARKHFGRRNSFPIVILMKFLCLSRESFHILIYGRIKSLKTFLSG